MVAATPVDLAKLVNTAKPIIRARYEYADVGHETLTQHIEAFIARYRLKDRAATPC